MKASHQFAAVMVSVISVHVPLDARRHLTAMVNGATQIAHAFHQVCLQLLSNQRFFINFWKNLFFFRTF
jgi:hypothetical protein